MGIVAVCLHTVHEADDHWSNGEVEHGERVYLLPGPRSGSIVGCKG